MSKVFGDPEKKKLNQIVAEGVTVMEEIKTLREGLNETIKAIAEELDIKPGEIKTAISVAQKGNWDEVYRKFDTVETIVEITGHAHRTED